MLRDPLTSYAIPQNLIKDIAGEMSTAVSAASNTAFEYSPEFVGSMTPLGLVRELNKYGVLNFKYDPRLLAEIQMLPD
jgi:hypothetical protein